MSRNLFPKHTVQWHFEEPTVLRKFSLSLVEMAVLTGITLRLYRALVTMHVSASWLLWGGSVAFGVLVLCAMATVHLANDREEDDLARAEGRGRSDRRRGRANITITKGATTNGATADAAYRMAHIYVD